MRLPEYGISIGVRTVRVYVSLQRRVFSYEEMLPVSSQAFHMQPIYR